MVTEPAPVRYRVGARVQLVDDIVRSRGKLKAGAQGTVVVDDLPWGHYSVQFDHGGPPLILAPRHLQRVAWRRRP
jgi:hypothetical protein